MTRSRIEIYREFEAWMKDGNVHQVSVDKYTTQCSQWSKEFTFEELCAYYKREYDAEFFI